MARRWSRESSVASLATGDDRKFSRAIAYLVCVESFKVTAIKGFSSKNSSAFASWWG